MSETFFSNHVLTALILLVFLILLILLGPRLGLCVQPSAARKAITLALACMRPQAWKSVPHAKPRPLNEAVVPSKTSCELAFTMPSARSEAMQAEFKGCGLAAGTNPCRLEECWQKLSGCDLSFCGRDVCAYDAAVTCHAQLIAAIPDKTMKPQLHAAT